MVLQFAAVVLSLRDYGLLFFSVLLLPFMVLIGSDMNIFWELNKSLSLKPVSELEFHLEILFTWKKKKNTYFLSGKSKHLPETEREFVPADKGHAADNISVC